MFKEILFYILSLIFPKHEDTYIKEYMIDTKYLPQYIYWIDDINILLSSYGYTEIYNTYSRKSNIIDTCSDCIYGYDRGFLYCKYENRDIQSMREFSSTVQIFDDKNVLLFSKDIFPTVVPLVCKKDIVILKTADPILEQKIYILDIVANSLKEEEFPENNDYMTRSKNLEKMVILDRYYRLWLYRKEIKKWKLF